MERVFGFLREIAQNNNKAWFDAHREAYREARGLFEDRTMELVERIGTFDERVKGLTIKDVTYRFNRDTRFSPDKSPYKRHFGAYINPWGKKSQMGGYYVHYEPGACMLAVGAYCLEPKQLRAVRESIVDNIDEYRGIVERTEFRKAFPMIGIEKVKTCPKGFTTDYPYVDYLRPKDYCAWTNVPDVFLMSDEWLDECERYFRLARPFMDFVNYAIEASMNDEERTDIF